MPDTPNTIETKPLQDTTESTAQPAPPIETQETPPADTTPVLRAAAPPEKESIPEVISTITSNATEVGNWFENNQTQLAACGISALVTVLFSVVILLVLRHVVSRGASRLSAGLGRFIHRLSMHIALLFLLTGLSYSNSLVHFPGQIDPIMDKTFFALFNFEGNIVHGFQRLAAQKAHVDIKILLQVPDFQQRIVLYI